jgi:nitric oxide synthase oxygenase domain/subunit
LKDFLKFYGIVDFDFEIDYNSIKRDFVDKEKKENLQKLYQELNALGDLRNNSSVLKDALMINLAYAFDLTERQISKIFWQSLLVFDVTHNKQYILLPFDENSESPEYAYVSI